LELRDFENLAFAFSNVRAFVPDKSATLAIVTAAYSLKARVKGLTWRLRGSNVRLLMTAPTGASCTAHKLRRRRHLRQACLRWDLGRALHAHGVPESHGTSVVPPTAARRRRGRSRHAY
jgi:hypothetical protein